MINLKLNQRLIIDLNRSLIKYKFRYNINQTSGVMRLRSLNESKVDYWN
jgi:hypothetical protein